MGGWLGEEGRKEEVGGDVTWCMRFVIHSADSATEGQGLRAIY